MNVWAAHFLQSFRSPTLDNVVIVFTNIASPIALSILAIILAIVLWLHGKKRHAIQFAMTLSLASIAVWLIKIYVQLPRPIGGLITESDYSFVSGHATYAVVFLMLIAYSYESHIHSTFLRWSLVVVAILLALLVGLSRIYLGVHYFTDVLGGFVLGAVIASASIIIFDSYDKK